MKRELWEVKECRDTQDHKDSWGPPEGTDAAVGEAHAGNLVCLDPKEITEKKALRVRLEREESRDQWDKWDPRGRQEFQGPQDSWGSRVYRDPRGQQVSWAHKVHRVFQVKTACREHQGRGDFRASQVYPAHLDRWE